MFPLAHRLRDCGKERRRLAAHPLPPHHSPEDIREREPVLRARHADVREASLFLELLVVALRGGVRKRAFLESREKHFVELEALRRMERDEENPLLLDRKSTRLNSSHLG